MIAAFDRTLSVVIRNKQHQWNQNDRFPNSNSTGNILDYVYIGQCQRA
jgi:hypothetical protein